ncbi:RHS repeat-associated core domain-containing protein, partial [Pseudomonas sp. B20(2017)]|uniref:RHS repeat-associated core domain-containing protein n=2 Tax=unclassified Pseudomonas TaxID=196821 RepID=UPI0015AA81F1
TQHRSFIYEPGTFRPLAMLDGKGPKRACPFYYQLDHLGTPQELTDYSGEVVWSAKYSAYGKVTSLELATEDYLNQPLRFQGQYFDDESGLHYNRHRYYDPDVGRYLTPDPVKLAGGLNQYRYVPNPTGWVDPLGLTSNCPPPKKPCRPVKHGTPGSVVNEGEPPLPKMTAQERRARIDELAEENAYRRLYEMEDADNGEHFLEKHGAQTTVGSQLERLNSGRNPTTGEIERYIGGSKDGQPKIPSAATHFLSHRDQLNAIYRAQLIFKYTNLQVSKRPIDMGKIIGEGYKKGSLEYGRQSKAVVILTPQQRVRTAYADFD